MNRYPRRLIEVDLPIRRISAHARREKVSHHGHISTLHIWWARRPLAACRAVILAALWPDPAPGPDDPPCPPAFLDAAQRAMTEWAVKHADKASQESFPRVMKIQANPSILAEQPPELRNALLDFIADFANWDNSTDQDFLDTARALVQAAHEALGGAPGTRPLVADPFAGGGSIPLEALRAGTDAFASDLNPVAVLLNKVVLEYIPTYGRRLADEVRKWGEWIRKEAEKELAEFYPKDADGATPIAYLWARTIRCEGPGCGATIPLVRNLQITRDSDLWHFTLEDTDKAQFRIGVDRGRRTSGSATVKAGSATCPRLECGYTTNAKAVRAQLARMHGGCNDATPLAVYIERSGTRSFRTATEADRMIAASAHNLVDQRTLPSDRINPIRPYKNTRGVSAVTRIGIERFGDLYTWRQAAAIQCLQRTVLRIPVFSEDKRFWTAVVATLTCVVSRFVFQNCSLSRWHASRSTIEGAFGKQALQVVWDFAEVNPLSAGPANWDGAVEWVLKVIRSNLCVTESGTAALHRAQDCILPSDSVDALVTDPPYFAAIPYGDLSNVFFVWERKVFGTVLPELFRPELVDQDDEIGVTLANVGPGGVAKDPQFYRAEMVRALDCARNYLKSTGVGVIVFAESRTSSWEVMLGAIIEAGLTITGSWPIDTELQNRTQAANSASLQSSVHIVCRPRENPDGSIRTHDVGNWRDLLAELPRRIHAWMPRLRDEGVVGADAIFACLGPALEIFSRYLRVEKASGEVVTLKEYLEHVWAAVSTEALSMIFEDADAAGLEPDARLTAMWLWTIGAARIGNGKAAADEDGEAEEEEDDDEDARPGKRKALKGFALEFDAARKIAQGLGIDLEKLSSIVEIKGETARLLPVAERIPHLFGKDATAATTAKSGRRTKQRKLFEELEAVEATAAGSSFGVGFTSRPTPGQTALDRVHQTMVLFGVNRGEALKQFLVDDGAGRDARFWKLAQSLSALYPAATDEKRWVDGVLARKKSLGF